jgi:type I restriction enzyme, S subunit
MSFPRYPKYKDSGVPWLGQVPEHWVISQSRRLFALRNERASMSDKQLTASQEHGVIYQEDFIRLEGRRVVEVIKGADILKHVESNDFVISMRSFQGGIEWCRHGGCISSAYVMLIPGGRVHAPFFVYLFKSKSYIQALQTTTNLVRDGQALRYDNFAQVPLPVVSMDEQAAIAAFLDRETAKIDALAAEQERLIELLKEKRQAVISHAITKGLNPNVPMKDSGVEWLGEIPAHWKTTQLKHATSMVVDCPHETPVYSADGPYLVIRTADLDRGIIKTEAMYRVNEAEYRTRIRRQSLLVDDVVYGREGERWGHAGLVPQSDTYCLGQRMMQFRARGESVSSAFLMWQLNAKTIYVQGELDTVGATSPHVNVATIRNYFLALPSLPEQRLIAEYLTARAGSLDRLVAEAQRAIDFLQERRTALISAAVTGQIDVREVAGRAA